MHPCQKKPSDQRLHKVYHLICLLFMYKSPMGIDAIIRKLFNHKNNKSPRDKDNWNDTVTAAANDNQFSAFNSVF